MAFPDRRTLNVLMTTLLFVVALAIVYVARAVIVIFAFAILFAYLINLIVRFLQRHSLFFKSLRGPHVAEAYLVLLILLGLIVHGLARQLLPQMQLLVRDSPAIMENVYSGDIAIDMGHRNGWDETQSLRAKALLQQRRESIRGLGESYTAVCIGYSRRPVAHLLLCCHAVPGLPARTRPGAHGRSP